MPRLEIKPVKLAQAIDEFLAKLAADRDPAPATLRAKRRTLTILTKHTARGEGTLTRNLKDHHFTDALLDLRNGASDGENAWRHRQAKGSRGGRGQTALKQDRATLKQFVVFLRRKKWVAADFDPTYEIGVAGRDLGTKDVTRTAKRRRIPEEDWPALFDAAPHPRDRFLIVCGMHWARRASDLVVMRWEHLDLATGAVELFNVKKGRRVGIGILPTHPTVAHEIERYVRWFEARYGRPTPDMPLFPRKVGSHELETFKKDKGAWPLHPEQPMLPAHVSIAVHKVLVNFYGPEADLYREGGHTLRRSGGRWVAVHCGLEVAQRLLDHQSLAQTRHYVGWSSEDETLSDFMRGAPPKANTPETANTPKGTTLAKVVDIFSRRRVA